MFVRGWNWLRENKDGPLPSLLYCESSVSVKDNVDWKKLITKYAFSKKVCTFRNFLLKNSKVLYKKRSTAPFELGQSH